MEQLEKMLDDVHLDEGIAAEILARLPAKSVLRFRAVCKKWLRITTCRAFLAEHARLRPLEVLLYTRTPAAAPDGQPDVGLQELNLHAVAVSGGLSWRPVARYPRGYCDLLASCDGLLLLGVGGGGGGADGTDEQYLICNPTTRQWSDLPRLSRNAGQQHRECGFYFHEPSGEYRLLYYVTFKFSSQAPYYCVLSAGADVPRRLSARATPIEQTVASLRICHRDYGSLYNLMTPAVLHGHLHWLQHMEAGVTGQMVAFDTVAETFRRMPPPPVTGKHNLKLLVVDGSLMACELDLLFVDLWALDGYAGVAATGKYRWERRHRVELPWRAESWQDQQLQVAVGDNGGDVVVGTQRGVLAYNVRSGGTVRQLVRVDASGGGHALAPSRRVFRESLVRHGFFETRHHPGLPHFSFCA